MTVKWTELLFSFRGRIRRLYFWLTTLVFGFAAGMLTSTFQFIAETYGMGETVPDTHQFEPTGPLSIAIFAVTLANLWVNLALSVKRLHTGIAPTGGSRRCTSPSSLRLVSAF